MYGTKDIKSFQRKYNMNPIIFDEAEGIYEQATKKIPHFRDGKSNPLQNQRIQGACLLVASRIIYREVLSMCKELRVNSTQVEEAYKIGMTYNDKTFLEHFSFNETTLGKKADDILDYLDLSQEFKGEAPYFGIKRKTQEIKVPAK